MSSTRRFFYRIYWRLEQFIVPGLKHSQSLYEDALLEHLDERVDWLELGCGHQILMPWSCHAEQEVADRCNTVVGLDYELSSLKNHMAIRKKICGDIAFLPFSDGSFDLVTANMVVEHLRDPEEPFREVYRILKPGGVFLFHTMNTFGYSTIAARLIPEVLKSKIVYLLEGRKEHDVFPTFYKVNSRKAVRSIADRIGFEVSVLRRITSSAKLVLIPPLLILELIWIRALTSKPLAGLRPNIIAILRK